MKKDSLFVESKISDTTKKYLIELAKKYETKDFLKNDPSQFLYYYKEPRDIELCAFVASLLSFGSRKQFIQKIYFIMKTADQFGGIYLWIKNFDFEKSFTISDNRKFYRFYSYKDFYYLFVSLNKILQEEETFGIFLSVKYQEECEKQINNYSKLKKHLIDIISENFKDVKIVPSTRTSAKKRLCMFLRWMVRDLSPVDIGFWTWYPKNDLLIPLDVHVLQESKKLGLISKSSSASRKTAELLTQKAKLIFLDDPTKLDFALFGLGVDNK